MESGKDLTAFRIWRWWRRRSEGALIGITAGRLVLYLPLVWGIVQAAVGFIFLGCVPCLNFQRVAATSGARDSLFFWGGVFRLVFPLFFLFPFLGGGVGGGREQFVNMLSLFDRRDCNIKL